MKIAKPCVLPKPPLCRRQSGYAHRGEKPFVLRPTKTRVEEVIGIRPKNALQETRGCLLWRPFRRGKNLSSDPGKKRFEVASVCCKVGGVPKEFLGLKDSEKVRVGTNETMCNPIAQAKVLNEAGTDFQYSGRPLRWPRRPIPETCGGVDDGFGSKRPRPGAQSGGGPSTGKGIFSVAHES